MKSAETNQANFDLSEIPQPIKVGFRDYRVELVKGWEDVRSENCGTHDFHLGVIRISAVLDIQNAAYVILHEIFHAVWLLFGLPDDERDGGKADEEQVCTCFGLGFSTVIRDNPGLFEWIEQALKGKGAE